MRSLRLCIALSCILPSLAFAQEGPPPDDDPQGVQAMRVVELDEGEARSRFRIAQAMYEGGRFLEAAEEFEQAFALSNRPSMLFNAYLAYRDAGRLEDSVRCLEGYLDGAPDAEDAARLSARARAMRRSLEESRAQEAEEAAERERLAAEAAEADARAQEEAARAAEARQRAEAAESRPHPVGWVVGGFGVASMIAGGVMAGVASGRFSDLETQCPANACPQALDLEDRRTEVRRTQLAADVLLIGGGAVTVTGVLLLLLVKRGSSAPEPSAYCDGSGCQMGLRGSF